MRFNVYERNPVSSKQSFMRQHLKECKHPAANGHCDYQYLTDHNHTQQCRLPLAPCQTAEIKMESPNTTPLQLSPPPYQPTSDTYVHRTHCGIPIISDSSRNEVDCRITGMQSADFSLESNALRAEHHLPPTQTVEPRMMNRQYDLLSNNHPSLPDDSYPTHLDYPFNSLELSYDSPSQPSVYQEQCAIKDDLDSPIFSDLGFESLPDKAAEDVNDIANKPYARLIYEALMQAPGHQMMLRDIYGWFVENTTKPIESGTNGWQNSIRHNLSMNQAFENDKSGPSSGRGSSRKANNSIWMLTEDAVRNGVQSTTRYRKTGASKKENTNRLPGVLRRRSGAKGGSSARRSVPRTKKQTHAITPTETCLPDRSAQLMHDDAVELDDSPPSLGVQCDYRPATPPANCELQPLYSLPATSYVSDSEFVHKVEHSDYFDDHTQLYESIFGFDHSPAFDMTSKIESN